MVVVRQQIKRIFFSIGPIQINKHSIQFYYCNILYAVLMFQAVCCRL
jgi:prolipoprotein diacylglyceryltransferase